MPWGTCEENSLYRPQPGDKPDYSVRMPLAPGFCALSMLFTDWNRSGTPSLRVSNDRQYYRGGEEQMWKIEPGKAPRLYGRADGWRHLSIFGMGIAEGDIDGSGFPQYALTSMGDTKLQELDPDEAGRGELPVYRDIAGEVGATAHIPYAGGDKRPSTGWHSEFADFNNAGLLDLFIAKGNVAQMPDFAAFDPNNLLLGQWNGKFVEAGDLAGLVQNRQGRGALIADFNLDGDLDLLVVNRAAPASLFRNLGADDGRGGVLPMGNWSEIRLVEPNPNRDAVGAKIAIKTGTRTQIRTVQVGGGDASGHAGWVHVGLGTAERAEIRVQWPDGEWSCPYRVFADEFVVSTGRSRRPNIGIRGDRGRRLTRRAPSSRAREAIQTGAAGSTIRSRSTPIQGCSGSGALALAWIASRARDDDPKTSRPSNSSSSRVKFCQAMSSFVKQCQGSS